LCPSYRLPFFISPGSPPTHLYPLSLHDALPICSSRVIRSMLRPTSHGNARVVISSYRLTSRKIMKRSVFPAVSTVALATMVTPRSEEHTSELQSRENLVCRLLLEKKK